ncbi:MAG: Uma2 family endonuclease [Ktedonobacteraceae bacterium]|nr:Uma2 family endonuclease [Ktedonobacteraceae bacterium]
MTSVEDYLALDRSSLETRYEYIDGYVTMLAGGTLDHATIGANIISTLRRLLRGSSCRVFTSDARVRLSRTRYVYPDASVSCNEQDRGQSDIVQFPHLVVEVLSPSTEGYDRGRKFGYYRECPSIQAYLLIDAQRAMVEVYRREKHDLWVLQTFRLADEVELSNLGVHFPVSAVYEDVVLPPQDGGGEP